MKATVITDASFCPKTRAGGWAAWVSYGRRRKVQKSGAFKKRPQNSTEAERWAALNGIYLAKSVGATNVLVQSDCMAVVEQLKREGVKARHVRGHTNVQDARSFVNRWCDKRAKLWMRKQRAEMQALF